MKTLRPVFALAALLLVAADDAPKGNDAIKGVWVARSLTVNGVTQPDDPTRGFVQIAFDGTSYVQIAGQTITEEGTYSVDPSKEPKAIDLVIEKGTEAGKRRLGIYRLGGETLTVALSEPGARRRPKGFDAGLRSGQSLVVFKRVRP
jgi:uncharacterized protein (TIGR03067 family)